jgi:hypothetical protein
MSGTNGMSPKDTDIHCTSLLAVTAIGIIALQMELYSRVILFLPSLDLKYGKYGSKENPTIPCKDTQLPLNTSSDLTFNTALQGFS